MVFTVSSTMDSEVMTPIKGCQLTRFFCPRSSHQEGIELYTQCQPLSQIHVCRYTLHPCVWNSRIWIQGTQRSQGTTIACCSVITMFCPLGKVYFLSGLRRKFVRIKSLPLSFLGDVNGTVLASISCFLSPTSLMIRNATYRVF